MQFSANLYHYTFNNPVNLKDPSGLDPYGRGGNNSFSLKRFYCDTASGAVSACLDGASVVATVTGQAEVAVPLKLGSIANYATTKIVCGGGPKLSDGTAILGTFLPSKTASILFSTADAVLNLTGQ